MELDQVECKYGETFVYKKWVLILRWSFSGQKVLSGQAYNAVFDMEGRWRAGGENLLSRV